MKISLAYILCFFFLISLPNLNVTGQTYLNQFHSKKAHSPTLDGSLHLLNLCEEQPESIQQIYKTGFNKFETSLHYSFADLAKENDFRQLCERNGMIHTGGPMLGNISPSRMNVWVRTLYPAPVEVQVENEGKTQTFGSVSSSEESDLTAIVKVSGLNPDTKYKYKVLVVGKPLNPDTETFFVTPPKKYQPAKTNIAFGSCYHRWGLCNQQLSEQIRSREPLAMLLNGDMAAQERNNFL